MEKRAIALISGGLDSALAAKIVHDQGIEVIGLHLLHPFLTFQPGRFPARLVCREIGIPLRVVYRGRELLRILEAPRFGFGSHLNPCIDCRILEFRTARALMEEYHASFVISGEVLGQRPMSQRRKVLLMMDGEEELDGLVLRPLSARRLPATRPEKEGIVDRERFFDWFGRERKSQLALARETGISGFSSPAGGCLLTDPAFCVRLADLLKSERPLRLGEVKLLRIGRHFRPAPETKLIVGRNHRENLILQAYCRKRRPYFLPEDFPGPEVSVSGPEFAGLGELCGGIISRYGKPPTGGGTIREIQPSGRERVFPAPPPIPEDKLREMLIGKESG